MRERCLDQLHAVQGTHAPNIAGCVRIEVAGELRDNLFYHPIDSDETRFDACLQ